MNFLCEVFRKLSSERQTESTTIIYHAALRVVNISSSGIHIFTFLYHHKDTETQKV